MEQLEALAAQGGAYPPALKTRPHETGMSLFLEGFSELTTCRQLGMSIGPIPWTAIHAYVETLGLTEIEAFEFHVVIRHMDNVWMKLSRKDSAPVATAAPPKPTGRSSGGGRQRKAQVRS